MIITNFKNLARNSLREKALEIAEAGYEAIKIESLIPKRIKLQNQLLKISHSSFFENSKDDFEINLGEFDRIFIIGIGKGSALACLSLAKILGDRLTGGIALDVLKVKSQKSNVKCFIGTHPLPSDSNILATQKIIKLAESLNEKDLLITFICGGGSALSCASEQELQDSTFIIRELTKAGANIVELNTVRKHLSEFKGGGFAKMACPATTISLIVSDVCGNDLSNVASGPTVFDKTTKEDAEDILKKYGLNPNNFNLFETPKDKKCFADVKNILFVCNQDAMMTMLEKSEELGFNVKIYSLALEGAAKKALLPMIKTIKSNEVILAAGETTVTLKNEIENSKSKAIGKGGRNQETVLGALALAQCQMSNVIVLSIASDGRDNIEAAGAIADISTIQKIKELNLNSQEFLENHNSFNFFEKTNDLVYAKQECFNVADLMIVLKK